MVVKSFKSTHQNSLDWGTSFNSGEWQSFEQMKRLFGRMRVQRLNILLKHTENSEWCSIRSDECPFGRISIGFGRMEPLTTYFTFVASITSWAILGIFVSFAPKLYIPLLSECKPYAYFKSFLPQLRTSSLLLSFTFPAPSLDLSFISLCSLHSSIYI